jgi:hypothetical protein
MTGYCFLGLDKNGYKRKTDIKVTDGFLDLDWFFSGWIIRGLDFLVFIRIGWLATTLFGFQRIGIGFFKERQTTAFQRFGFSLLIGCWLYRVIRGVIKKRWKNRRKI